MRGDGLSGVELVAELHNEGAKGGGRFGCLAVGDGKGAKVESYLFAQSGFLSKSKLGLLVRGKHRDEDIHAGSANRSQLIFQPVAAARAWHKGDAFSA